MAGKVVSIEIGNSLTKVALVDYKAKTTKVHAAFTFETPEGTIDDGYIKNTEEFCEKLASLLAANQINERRVVFAISSSKIANREVTLPYVSKDKIMSMVRANASDYFPVDIKNYHLSYNMLEKIMTKEEKSMKLLLLAVPLDLLETYFDLAKVMNMALLSIDYAGNAIVQATKNLKKTETNVVVHLNEKNSIISIMENGVLALQRTIAYGSDVVIDAMLNIDKYRYDDSMSRDKIQNILLTSQMINTVMPENDDIAYTDNELSEDEKERSIVTSSLRYLIGNITRVLDYYMTKTAGARVDVIYVSGVGSEYKGLRELFSFEIGSQVKTFKDVEGISYTPSDNAASLPVMIVAIGASKDPMNLMPSEFAQKAVRKVSLVGPAAVLIGGIAISAALIAYGSIAKAMEEKTKADLQAQLDDMQQYVEIKNRYDSSLNVYNNITGMYYNTQNMNKYIVDFIEELEEKMPSSFKTGSLNVNEAGVNFNVEVAEYVNAAEVIQQLRKFDTLDPNSISAVSFTKYGDDEDDDESAEASKPSEDENEVDAEKKVVFSISASYNMSYSSDKVAEHLKVEGLE